jgi:hypothetical protein
MTLSGEKLTALLNQALPPDQPYEIHSVLHVNFKPHPYTIGPQHIANSKGVYLEPDSAPCAYRPYHSTSVCSLSYAEHTSDYVIVIKLNRDTTPEELKPLGNLEELMQAHKLDGFVFLEGPYKVVAPPAQPTTPN